ncbi:hypothetical protein EKL29_10810 [Pantoea sp. YU22]|uniref:hypothetical protein n=1 Tax=Pantoea TaxID=53335 RepID=UPI000F873896|nr:MULTISPECIES: hypothetical protein [Pantoea]RTY57549.1 hypothetical protein EKL29_10810 [Pantoea sp. YU22]
MKTGVLNDDGSVQGAASKVIVTNNSKGLTIAEKIGILRDAAKSNKGNFGLGSATAKEANTLGEAGLGLGIEYQKTEHHGSMLMDLESIDCPQLNQTVLKLQQECRQILSKKLNRETSHQ